MAQKKPLISIIVCTYNGEKILEKCLNSILNQSYKNFEIICIDGMSIDKTQDIIKEFVKKDKRIHLLINKNRLPEGKGNGKWLGYIYAKGKILGFIDQDNVLQTDDLFEKILILLNKNKSVLGILGCLKHDNYDGNAITRYTSIFGTDSFFAYRSIDFIKNFYESYENTAEIKMSLDNTYLTGGNCFFYLKTNLKKIGGYMRDVLNVQNLIKNGNNKLIIVKDAIKHYSERDFKSLILKKYRWADIYFKDTKNRFNYFPQTKKEFIEFSKNIIFNFTIVLNFYYSFKLYKKFKDYIVFLFPFIAFLNSIAYGLNFIRSKIE